VKGWEGTGRGELYYYEIEGELECRGICIVLYVWMEFGGCIGLLSCSRLFGIDGQHHESPL